MQAKGPRNDSNPLTNWARQQGHLALPAEQARHQARTADLALSDQADAALQVA